jgi:hypothetical protein
MKENKKLTVVIASKGEGGNIYSVLWAVKRAMLGRGLFKEVEELYADVLHSDSYAEAIERIRRDVYLVDADGAV